jgi:hypothetical protein
MRSTRVRHLNVKLSEPEHTRFQRLAEDLGETISTLVRRWAVDAYRARYGTTDVAREARRGR